MNVGPKGQKRPSDHPDILKAAYKVCDGLSTNATDSTFTTNEWLAKTIDDISFKGQNLKKLLDILHTRGYIIQAGQEKWRAVK